MQLFDVRGEMATTSALPMDDAHPFIHYLIEHMENPWTLLLLTWAVVIPAIVLFPLYRPRLVFVGDKRKVRAMVTSRAGVVRRGRVACVALVNSKSGGQLGPQLLSALRQCLPSHQVIDLGTTDPAEALGKWAHAEGTLRLLVCGGDGTAGWVMNAASKVFGKPDAKGEVDGARGAQRLPPIAILPLGTGNDLARSYGWGGGVKPSAISTALAFDYFVGVAKADVLLMDRWRVHIVDFRGATVLDTCMNNYFSIGIDAAIAKRFHEERNANPSVFSSVSKNKLMYAKYGVESLIDGRALGDGVRVSTVESDEEVRVNPLWSGVVIANVPCYQGGKNFWGDDPCPAADEYSGFCKPLVPVSCSDGLLEVMALSGTLHIGLVQVHFDSAIRLAQLPSVCIEVEEPICVQVDGEPRQIKAGRITITREGQYPMLRRGPSHGMVLEDLDAVGFGPLVKGHLTGDGSAPTTPNSDGVRSEADFSRAPSTDGDTTTDNDDGSPPSVTLAETLTLRHRFRENNAQ